MGWLEERLLEQDSNCLNGTWQSRKERGRLDNDSPAASRRRVTGSGNMSRLVHEQPLRQVAGLVPRSPEWLL